MGVWDYSLKTLIAYAPEAFVAMMRHQIEIQAALQTAEVAGSTFAVRTFDGDRLALTSELMGELQANTLDLEILRGEITITGRLATEFQGYDLDADGVTEDGEELLFHFEFQSTNDPTIPERMLEYSFRAIFLRPDGNVPEPPLCWMLRNGKKILVFEYVCIRLWEWTPEELLALNQPALLPLLPLTKGGASRTIVKRMYQGLLAHGLQDLMPVANSLAAQAFGEHDKLWLERMFAKMKKNILKDSWGYEFMTREARAEGIAEGREIAEQARKEAVERFQQAVLAVVDQRFPKLRRPAKNLVRGFQDMGRLQQLLIHLSTTKTPAEAEHYLMHFEDEDAE